VPSLDQAACVALMDELTRVTAGAAAAILDLAINLGVRTKPDGSPVTAADETAEAIIYEGLRRLAPAVPVISEERAAREDPIAVVRGSYFLVDPLDGTREFIAGRNEFTINIALLTDGAPMLGIICAPALGHFWRGIVGRAADRIAGAETDQPTPIQVQPWRKSRAVVMVSRTHLEERTKAYVESLHAAKVVPCGSAMKFCRVAEGAADLYPRLAPTRDWDVAAGHAILEAAGGKVVAPDGGRIVYGTTGLEIQGFLAWGDPECAV
jgi:3'(2'), 5'-bisphosphate nucleotidase